MNSRLQAFALLAALAASVSAPALAQIDRPIIRIPFVGQRSFQLDIHAGFSYVGRGLATGVRFGIPVVHNGFIRKINNAIYINFGADLYYLNYSYKDDDMRAIAVGIPVAFHWEFYFTPHWSAFGEAGPNFFMHPSVFKGHGWDWSPGHWFSVGAGGRYFIQDSLALTLRLGSPYSSFGVTFLF